MMRKLLFVSMVSVGMLLTPLITVYASSPQVAVDAPQSIEEIFTPEYRNQTVMRVEAAIALSQAEFGIIPPDAANEVHETATIAYAPLDAIAEEYEQTNHRMVALLNVWKRSLSPEAANALHYGVTTVDIYGTVRVLQLIETIDLLMLDMIELEDQLLDLAAEHRDTVMIGRTLGQHALPITFGKKVSVWAAQNRRNIERMKEVRARLMTRGVLKGAVGTHLGLGEFGVEVEHRTAARLGLSEPEPADWQSSRDVFAEYGLVLALLAKSYGSVAEEVFWLTGTDIGELRERQPASQVGSSTMPHKVNPRNPDRVIAYSRLIPRLSEILLDDVVNSFERDSTAAPNRVLEDISLEAGKMLRATHRLIRDIEVDEAQMRANIDRTDNMIMGQRLMLYLADFMDRTEAEERVRDAARTAMTGSVSFREALLNDPELALHLDSQLDTLLSADGYLGLSREQVDLTRAYVETMKKTD
jgi:adenylosuccinate lyase